MCANKVKHQKVIFYFSFISPNSQFPASPIPPVSSASLFPIFPLPGSAILHCIWLCGSPTPLLWHSQFSFLILVPHSPYPHSQLLILPFAQLPICSIPCFLFPRSPISRSPTSLIPYFKDSLYS